MLTSQRGFTLIELLIVIGIIGILSSIVLVSVSQARERALVAKAKSELQSIGTMMDMSRLNTDSVLQDITGRGWSQGPCTSLPDLRGISTSSDCYIQWAEALDAIVLAAQEPAANLYRDSWGSPYLLDENEGVTAGTPCVQDMLRSVGPDGLFNTSDDIIFRVPYSLGVC